MPQSRCVRSCLQADHWRENNVTCADEQRKCHKAQSDDIAIKLMGHKSYCLWMWCCNVKFCANPWG